MDRRAKLASSVTSSNFSTNNLKTSDEAVLQQLFAKVANVVVQARCKTATSGTANKWFNIDTPDHDPLRSELKFWKSMIATPSAPIQPMILDIYLDISDLYDSDQLQLMLRDQVSMRWHRISFQSLCGTSFDPITGAEFDVKKKRILLESWQLTLLQPPPTFPPDTPVMYKKCVMFFRSLYSHVRLLPAHRLFRKLAKSNPASTTESPMLKIGYRLSSSRAMPVDEAGLDQLHTKDSRNGMGEYNFGSLETSIGTVSLHVMYRTECDFAISHSDSPPTRTSTPSNDSNYFSTMPSKPGSLHHLLREDHSSTHPIKSSSTMHRPSSLRTSTPIATGTSPRSLGAMGRPSFPQTGTGGVPITHRAATPVGSIGSTRIGAASPAFSLSGSSFPRSYGAGAAGTSSASGLTDAIAMGMFDGVKQTGGGLPFSVKPRGSVASGGGGEAEWRSMEDVFGGMEESPPFHVYGVGGGEKNAAGGKIQRYGTSISSTHSATSTLSHRHSITFPRTTLPPSFTTTILNKRVSDPTLSRSSLHVPSSTPPRTPFSTSLSHSPSFNPQVMISAAAAFGAQTPPPYVTRVVVGSGQQQQSGSSLGSGGGGVGSRLQQYQHAGAVVGELGEFLKTVDSRRRSLAAGSRGKGGLLMEGSEVSGGLKKGTKIQSLAKFKQLKDSYHEFSHSLTTATGGRASAEPGVGSARTATPPPPPVLFTTSPTTPSKPAPAQPLHVAPHGASPKHFDILHRGSTPLIRASTPPTLSHYHDKPILRRPSSLHQVSVLSTVMSESGDDSSSSSAATAPAIASPIPEEHGDPTAARERVPQRPPPANTDAPPTSSRWTRPLKFPAAVLEPARVSSGFFPVADPAGRFNSDRTSSNLSSTGSSAGVMGPDEVMRTQSPALPIHAVAVGGGSGTVGQGVASSSLSTSLRSQQPPRGASVDRAVSVGPVETVGVARRNSIGNGLSGGGGGGSKAAVSEGVSAVAGRVGKLGGRFGSAPVEVPFVRRGLARGEYTWDTHDDEEEEEYEEQGCL
ncbi:autophagy protein 13 [Podochytrium sp. JEL0797]|nr:autophagy protein 13 [Podochytrium sp. JEL0797]